MPDANPIKKSNRTTRLCEIVDRGHGCCHGDIASTPTPLMSCKFLKVPGHESGILLGCIVVGGTGEPPDKVMHQLRHGGQEVHELILQLVGTLGNPQLNRHGGQEVGTRGNRQLNGHRGHTVPAILFQNLQKMSTRGAPQMRSLHGHVLGALTTKLCGPQRSRQA